MVLPSSAQAHRGQIAEAAIALPQHPPVSAGPGQSSLQRDRRLAGDNGPVLRRRRFRESKGAVLAESQTAEKQWGKPRIKVWKYACADGSLVTR